MVRRLEVNLASRPQEIYKTHYPEFINFRRKELAYLCYQFPGLVCLGLLLEDVKIHTYFILTQFWENPRHRYAM